MQFFLKSTAVLCQAQCEENSYQIKSCNKITRFLTNSTVETDESDESLNKHDKSLTKSNDDIITSLDLPIPKKPVKFKDVDTLVFSS